jgi:hypothetical protein
MEIMDYLQDGPRGGLMTETELLEELNAYHAWIEDRLDEAMKHQDANAEYEN